MRLVAAMLFAVVFLGCGSLSPAPLESANETSSAQVDTVVVERADLDSVFVTAGQVVASPVVAIRAPESGTITYSSSVVEGSRVAKGNKLFSVAEQQVTAGAAGEVVTVLAKDGDQVAAGLPVVSLRLQQFAIQATVSAESAYRVYTLPTEGTAEVTGGPGGLKCQIFSPASPEPDEQGKIEVLCVLDADAAVVESLPALVGIKTGAANGVLVLPVSAVQGDTQHGVVSRVENGVLKQVEVGLGISDGVRVEITSGLAEGDEVASFAPGLS